jgi:hypothetical protein
MGDGEATGPILFGRLLFANEVPRSSFRFGLSAPERARWAAHRSDVGCALHCALAGVSTQWVWHRVNALPSAA